MPADGSPDIDIPDVQVPDAGSEMETSEEDKENIEYYSPSKK